MTTRRKPTTTQTHSKSTFSKSIGKLVQQERLKAKLSEEAVAKYLGISPLVLTAYEAGARTIPLNHIYALSNCLNISPAAVIRLINQTLPKL